MPIRISGRPGDSGHYAPAQAGGVVARPCAPSMPDLDGIETTHRIRQLANANALTPIIAHTMDAGFSDPETWQAAGMDGYVAKPLREENLLALLVRWGLLKAD